MRATNGCDCHPRGIRAAVVIIGPDASFSTAPRPPPRFIEAGLPGLPVRRLVRPRLQPRRDRQSVPGVDLRRQQRQVDDLALGEVGSQRVERGVRRVAFRDERQRLDPLQRRPLAVGVVGGLAPARPARTAAARSRRRPGRPSSACRGSRRTRSSATPAASAGAAAACPAATWPGTPPSRTSPSAPPAPRPRVDPRLHRLPPCVGSHAPRRIDRPGAGAGRAARAVAGLSVIRVDLEEGPGD